MESLIVDMAIKQISLRILETRIAFHFSLVYMLGVVGGAGCPAIAHMAI